MQFLYYSIIQLYIVVYHIVQFLYFYMVNKARVFWRSQPLQLECTVLGFFFKTFDWVVKACQRKTKALHWGTWWAQLWQHRASGIKRRYAECRYAECGCLLSRSTSDIREKIFLTSTPGRTRWRRRVSPLAGRRSTPRSTEPTTSSKWHHTTLGDT